MEISERKVSSTDVEQDKPIWSLHSPGQNATFPRILGTKATDR